MDPRMYSVPMLFLCDIVYIFLLLSHQRIKFVALKHCTIVKQTMKTNCRSWKVKLL